MTHAEILCSPAGRELDARVAERVMGWRHPDDAWYVGPAGERVSLDGLPHFSTNPGDAWQVVERLQGLGVSLSFQKAGPGHRWLALVDGHTSYAPTFPLALCRAALLATDTPCAASTP